MTVFLHVTTAKLRFLLDLGFILEKANTVYELGRYVGQGVVCILYVSGKLLLQGKVVDVAKVTLLLEKKGFTKADSSNKASLNQSESSRYDSNFDPAKESGWVIGSDETLKGDTFGGIVVAAVKADATLRLKLLELGVDDSKKLSDEEMIPLAQKIRALVSCEVRSLLPEEYNTHSNQTLLLNMLHKECALALGEGTHIVDKFPGCVVGNIIEEKADSRYVEVAAASIIARVAGLEQLRFLSGRTGFVVPKGSTHVREALEMVKRKGLDPTLLVKMNFRNVKDVFDR